MFLHHGEGVREDWVVKDWEREDWVREDWVRGQYSRGRSRLRHHRLMLFQNQTDHSYLPLI